MPQPTQGTLQRQPAFAYGSVTLYGRPFQVVLLANCLLTPVEGPTTPQWKPPRFGLFPFRSPLLRKSLIAFSSWGYLDVSVCPVRLTRAMCSPGDDAALPAPGCPIRKSPDQRLFAPPRGLSQLTTSFIAFLCQGIHYVPFVA